MKLLSLKQNQTWKWIRMKHVINGMGLRMQENYHGISCPKIMCSLLNHKSIISLVLDWFLDMDWVSFIKDRHQSLAVDDTLRVRTFSSVL